MAGFSLYVSNTTSTKRGFLCYKDQSSDTPSVDQTIPCSIYGRYVIYYNERSRNRPSHFSQYAYNELCELQVFGEYIPNYLFFTYFKTRLNFCLFCSFRFWIGCRGNYGVGCLYACPTNCLNGKCEEHTGHCLSCSAGYYGQFCPTGLYYSNKYLKNSHLVGLKHKFDFLWVFMDWLFLSSNKIRNALTYIVIITVLVSDL